MLSHQKSFASVATIGIDIGNSTFHPIAEVLISGKLSCCVFEFGVAVMQTTIVKLKYRRNLFSTMND